MKRLKQLFGVKEKLWEGPDEKQCQAICEHLGTVGIWTQSFKVNQETPKCNGNCGSCASSCNFDEDTPIWEKMGSGFSDDLLNHKSGEDIYAIYVLKSELENANKAVQNFQVLQEMTVR